MKTQKLNEMTKKADAIAAFGKKNFANAKQIVKLDAALTHVNNTTGEKVVDEILKYFKETAVQSVPKNLRGIVKNELCKCVRYVVSNYGALPFLNSNGTVNPARVLNKFNKSFAGDLLTIWANCKILDAAGKYIEKLDADDKKAAERAEKLAQARAKADAKASKKAA